LPQPSADAVAFEGTGDKRFGILTEIVTGFGKADGQPFDDRRLI